MQFRRTAVAVAIAGIAAASPQIASADTVLSGAIGIQIGADDRDIPLDEDEMELPEGSESENTTSDPVLGFDDGVFGVVATHTMNSGLSAFGSVRFDSTGFSGADVTSDNIYLGVKGGFGELRVGEVPVAAEYGQVANDIFDGFDGIDTGVSYTGGFGPVTIGANWSPARNDDVIGIGARFNIGGFSVGVGGQDRDELVSFSAGASFGFAGASVAVHFVDVETDDGADNTNIVGINVGYGIAGASVSVTHMIQTLDGGDGAEDTATRLDVGYGLGGGLNASVRLNFNAPEDGEDTSDWRFLLSKSF